MGVKGRDHIVVIGYGTKDRSALATLVVNGHERESFTVVDRQPDRIADANADVLPFDIPQPLTSSR